MPTDEQRDSAAEAFYEGHDAAELWTLRLQLRRLRDQWRADATKLRRLGAKHGDTSDAAAEDEAHADELDQLLERTTGKQFAVDPTEGAPLEGLRAPTSSDVVSRVPDQGWHAIQILRERLAEELKDYASMPMLGAASDMDYQLQRGRRAAYSEILGELESLPAPPSEPTS